MVRVREYGASVATRRLWRVAVLAAAGAIGASPQAEAALYWSDFDSGFSQPWPMVTQRRQKPRLRQAKKIAAPMGVFSVIQKHKLHHANSCSSAPMPYMHRITGSGVAMHAGVLPGYPASHGCIRMPMAFAIKMWNWTRMGARVVVTPGEMTPANFSHPLLVAQKVVPQPNVADEPKPDAPAAASLELRPTVGHDGGVKPVVSEPPAAP